MTSKIHINSWIEKAQMDFYTMFIKAWIPFNAWYLKEFYDEGSNRISDKNIIDYLKSNSNKYRDKIISLLKGTDNITVLPPVS